MVNLGRKMGSGRLQFYLNATCCFAEHWVHLRGLTIDSAAIALSSLQQDSTDSIMMKLLHVFI